MSISAFAWSRQFQNPTYIERLRWRPMIITASILIVATLSCMWLFPRHIAQAAYQAADYSAARQASSQVNPFISPAIWTNPSSATPIQRRPTRSFEVFIAELRTELPRGADSVSAHTTSRLWLTAQNTLEP